ncbi:MAG: nucleotidyltransferase domain-containing protein [Deltaproteobacteria bacterium]|nr:nucleotidyltransferase domain-containing protein [Nannocystaceae bacterium]
MSSPSQEVVAQLREVLRARHDVELALLFGSFARGQETERSDLDVAVHAPGVDLLELGARLVDATSREVDLIPLEDADIPLREELVRDAFVLHERRPGAATRWRFHAMLELETDGPWYRRMRDAFLARLAARPDAR